MFPGAESPGLLIIPSRNGREDEVWFLARPPSPGAPAFSGGGQFPSPGSWPVSVAWCCGGVRAGGWRGARSYPRFATVLLELEGTFPAWGPAGGDYSMCPRTPGCCR